MFKFKVLRKTKLMLPAFLLLLLASLSSCGDYLVTTSVGYQAVKIKQNRPPQGAESAEIVAGYVITSTGDLTVGIRNKTNEIMIIDQTKSFFINSNNHSTSYYDSTIHTTTTTDITSNTSGASVNLGAVAGAFGVGGAVGRLLSGVNVGGAETQGQQISNTVYKADTPTISIGPYGTASLSKTFNIDGIGKSSISIIYDPLIEKASKKAGLTSYTDNRYAGLVQSSYIDATYEKSDTHFSVCITYSVDNGETFKQFISDFYVSDRIVLPVAKNGQINEPLRQILSIKPTALYEPWWIIHFSNSMDVDTEHSGLNTIKKDNTNFNGFINYQ